jgi:hypothetical protein
MKGVTSEFQTQTLLVTIKNVYIVNVFTFTFNLEIESVETPSGGDAS